MTQKVLLVDDVLMFLELERTFLKQTAVQVLTARDGQEALDAVRQESPSLVFMDLHMPRMDGAACCSRLKADPVHKNIPVILITAEGKDDDRKSCVLAGCDGFLTKPLDRRVFLETARHHLATIDRRSTRVACPTRGKFRVFGVTLSGEVLDVSDGGVYLATSYAIEAGAAIDIVFTLPDAYGTVIQARGRVAWTNRGTALRKPALPEGVGIEFLSIAEGMQTAIRQYIATGRG
jgi:CheY-like chemotaxis protein